MLKREYLNSVRFFKRFNPVLECKMLECPIRLFDDVDSFSCIKNRNMLCFAIWPRAIMVGHNFPYAPVKGHNFEYYPAYNKQSRKL